MLMCAALHLPTQCWMLQLTACLSQYEPLGPEFREVASDYRTLLEDLEHAEFALEEFRKIAEGDGHTP